MLTLEEAVGSVRAYNARPDYLAIDREVHGAFRGGLGGNQVEIEEQLRLVGSRYEGVSRATRQQTAMVSHLTPQIGAAIAGGRAEFLLSLNSVPLFSAEAASDDTIAHLFSFFRKPFTDRLGKVWQNWVVWGGKTWHFLRPESFPILDAKVERVLKKRLGLKVRSAPVERYLAYSAKLRDYTNTRGQWLTALTEVDAESSYPSWSALKLWDKAFFNLDP